MLCSDTQLTELPNLLDAGTQVGNHFYTSATKKFFVEEITEISIKYWDRSQNSGKISSKTHCQERVIPARIYQFQNQFSSFNDYDLIPLRCLCSLETHWPSWPMRFFFKGSWWTFRKWHCLSAGHHHNHHFHIFKEKKSVRILVRWRKVQFVQNSGFRLSLVCSPRSLHRGTSFFSLFGQRPNQIRPSLV